VRFFKLSAEFSHTGSMNQEKAFAAAIHFQFHKNVRSKSRDNLRPLTSLAMIFGLAMLSHSVCSPFEIKKRT
jgi:hypothetical protein